VLEHVAFVDVPSGQVAACNLTIYRHREVVVPFNWTSESLVKRWSENSFALARASFRQHTHLSCFACEPANRGLHQQLSVS
jgi:hypothetical protein